MTVSIEKDGFVWTVVHDRINARNAMDPESAQAICDAMLAFDADAEARVAVLWGAGGAFCAGWDLKYAGSLDDPQRFHSEVVEQLAFDASKPANANPRGPLGPTRLELSKPTIAAVEGPAVAGGMELALWCDIRVMAEDAYFGVYCRRWGITLLDGGTVRLPRLVGQGRALEITLTGRKVPAEEACRIGLCESVVPRGAARAEAERMAHEIARFPQGAVLADRRSIIETRGMPVREALALEWRHGVEAARVEGIGGATRFAGGAGRHGDFKEILSMARTASTMLALGTPAPDFSLPDVVSGRSVSRDDFADRAVLLVMFICRHCPFVKHVQGELARIGRDYAGSAVGIVAISANDAASHPEDSPASLAQMAREQGFVFPLLHDESQAVAKAYGAACTPDYFVFDAQRRLAYRGQLDDSRPGNGVPVSGRDVRAALDALCAGRPAPAEQRPSVGCNIKWKAG